MNQTIDRLFIAIISIAAGFALGYNARNPEPEVIIKELERQADSLIHIENRYYRTINEIHNEYNFKKDSIVLLADSEQLNLFLSNSQRFSYLRSDTGNSHP